MDKVRTAVVGGGGGIGLGSHLPAIAALPQAELVAICDVDEQGLARAAELYGCHTCTDYGSLLERDDIDLIDIASPDFLHASHAIAAAEAGKHVLCEKPMALSLDEASAMRAAVGQAGVKFMVAQSQRWLPECAAFKAACQQIGHPVFTAYHVKGRFYSYPRDSFYRTKQSGGQFVHNGMHWVDFISWCIDSLPASVYAQSTRHYPTDDRMETDNYFVAHVTYDNGATGIYELNLLMLDPPGFPSEQRWYVIGTEGTAEWARDATRLTEVFSQDGLSFPRAYPEPGLHSPFAGEIGHMCDCILRDDDPCIPIDWSIRVLAACLAVAESARTGHLIHLAHDL